MGRLIRHGSRRRRAKKLLVPAGVVAALAVAGGSYLYSESGKVTLVTKEETTIDEFSDKLGVDSDDLRRWNKKLGEELSEGVEVVAKIDLDKEEDQQEYTIQVGDTVDSIAARFGLTTETLAKVDKSLRSNAAIAKNYGEEVEIYGRNSTSEKSINYIIESGDTLTSISDYLGVNIDDIKEQNNLTSDTILAGHVLSVTATMTDDKYEEVTDRNEKLAYQLYLDLAQGDVKVPEETSRRVEEDSISEQNNMDLLSGIDVSAYQKQIDWAKVKESGVDYAIIKMFDSYFMKYQRDPETLELTGELSQLDSEFVNNVTGCQENGIPYGIYIYSRAVTEEQARVEASKFIKFAKQYQIQPSWPIYFDVEPLENEPFYDENGNAVNAPQFFANHPDQIVKNFKAWADVLEENGYYCGIYCNDNGLKQLDPQGTQFNDYAVWVAKFKYAAGSGVVNNDELLTVDYSGNYGIYQFSETGTCPGIDSLVDRSYASIDYGKYIEQAGFNQLTNTEALEKVKVLQ